VIHRNTAVTIVWSQVRSIKRRLISLQTANFTFSVFIFPAEPHWFCSRHKRNYLSYSIQLADAFIGATTIAYGLPILKGNDKHYKIFKGMQIKIFRP
jgi:predicted nucleic acid-binding protein